MRGFPNLSSSVLSCCARPGLLLGLLLATPALAVETPYRREVKNETGADKTDFHLVLETLDPNGKLKLKGAGLKQAPPNGAYGDLKAWTTIMGGNGNTEIAILDFVGAIPKDGRIYSTLTVESTGLFNGAYTAFGKFTPENSPTDIPDIGLRVANNGDVFVTNAASDGLMYSNLSVSINSSFLTEDQAFDLLTTTDPSGPFSGSVSPGGEAFIGNFPKTPSQVLTLRTATAFSSGSSVLTTDTLYEYGIPEPMTGSLCCIGVVFLCVQRKTQSIRC